MTAVQEKGYSHPVNTGYRTNEMELVFDAISCNEGFARMAVAAFVMPLNPTLEELADVKTAVSEAVTNAIIHGYGNIGNYMRPGEGRPGEGRPGVEPVPVGKVTVYCRLDQGILSVDVKDQGKGIANIARAMEPLYTSRPELERSGMGFSLMEAFMDDLEVESTLGVGTCVHMKKKMCAGSWMSGEE